MRRSVRFLQRLLGATDRSIVVRLEVHTVARLSGCPSLVDRMALKNEDERLLDALSNHHNSEQFVGMFEGFVDEYSEIQRHKGKLDGCKGPDVENSGDDGELRSNLAKYWGHLGPKKFKRS